MKIGFVTSEYPLVGSSFGGIGTYVQTLALAMVQNGHQVNVLTAQENPPSEDHGVNFLQIPRVRSRVSQILRTRRLIDSLLASHSLDVVEAPECESHLIPYSKCSFGRIHGSHHFWRSTIDATTNRRRLFLEQVGIRSARHLSAPTQYAADKTRAVMHLGNRSIEILPNPVDTDLFSPAESITPGRIAFAGTLVEKKGVAELLRAFASLASEFPAAELHIAGRDPAGGDSQSSFFGANMAALSPATRSRIRLLGVLAPKQVATLFASSQICCLPSKMETQGNVFVEAMACGRPVIAGDRGPAREVLAEGTGWLVDPDDPTCIAEALSHALLDAEECSNRGNQGRIRAALFSIDQCAERHVDFYSRMLEENPR